jgi:hypothetical protein
MRQSSFAMGWGPLESDVPGTRPRAERLAGCPWPSCGRRMIFLPPLSLDFLRIAKDKVQCGRARPSRTSGSPERQIDVADSGGGWHHHQRCDSRSTCERIPQESQPSARASLSFLKLVPGLLPWLGVRTGLTLSQWGRLSEKYGSLPAQYPEVEGSATLRFSPTTVLLELHAS